MSGAVKFLKMIVLIGLLLGSVGVLKDFVLIIGRKAVEAHQSGGIKFTKLNKQISH